MSNQPTQHRETLAVDRAESVATARTQTAEEIARYRYKPRENIWLGSYSGKMIGYEDDRHMVTIAGNRGGKGISAIVPVLLDYPASVFVLDPKGENANLTAERRGQGNANIEGMGQKVVVLDPYGVADQVPDQYRGGFSPIEWLPDDLGAIGEADTLAESLIIHSDKESPHWSENAQTILQAIILHVKSSEWINDSDRNLIKVRQLLTGGDLERKERTVRKLERQLAEARLELESPDDPDTADYETLQAEIEELELAVDNATKRSGWDYLLASMSQNDRFEGYITRWVESWHTSAPNERLGFLSTARTNTKFLEDPQMQTVLGESTFSLKEFRENPNGFSLYLCLPAGKLGSSGRWLRAMLTQTIQTFEKLGTVPKETRRTLFVLDEFASLGHMQTMEKYGALIAGYGVKFWYIYQDLQQLQRSYKESWETFLNSAGVIQAFSTTDKLTTEYLSARMGKVEMERERTTTSTSTSHGTSEGTTSGDQEGFAPGSNFQGDAEKASQAGRTGFVKTGASSGLSSGSSSSTSTSQNTASQFVVNSLKNPDELAIDLRRENKIQLLLISGEYPVFIDREYYFEHKQFRGKYDSGQSLDDLKREGAGRIKRLTEELYPPVKAEIENEEWIRNVSYWAGHITGWGALICIPLGIFGLLNNAGWALLPFGLLLWGANYFANGIEENSEQSIAGLSSNEVSRQYDFWKSNAEHWNSNPLKWMRAIQDNPSKPP